MARKKKTNEQDGQGIPQNVEGLRAEVLEQGITDTLESNFMPYAMSVIMSRAIPEIDGFKPSHRKLLYTMYKMGLLTGARTKSANIVGQTMKLNPHGDAAIYETMVRLSKGNGSLIAPLVDSKGNFGKVYSRDMAYAASRYTEAKLSAICAEIFRDVDQDTVDFTDNYDGSMKEPVLLPTTFPNVLVSANTGIAVGMASQTPGFNLVEVCETAIAYINDENHDILSTLPAPDFPTGGEIIYSADEMREIYRTGRGSVRVRSRWRYLPSENIIEVYEIPYSTTAEAIIDKVAEHIKNGKIKEISDMRDETGLSGLRLAIDLKRGVNFEKLMQRLFKMTPLQDSFSCNFNILVAGNPRTMGIAEILEEWVAWRSECVRRRVYHELGRKRERLHLLNGLKKILLDIDKAIKIIRETETEAEVVPNLMIGFGIDEPQAEFVAEIRLRNINREYILKRTGETDALEKEIGELESILESRRKIRAIIVSELRTAAKKYGEPRKTGIVHSDEVEEFREEDATPDYAVNIFLSREGYFKKITPQSLRMSGEQKYKENDELFQSFEANNRDEMLVFTNMRQVYKARCSDFEDSKASLLGDYLPSVLGMDEGELVTAIVMPGDYSGDLILFFENGKAARIELAAYATKTNRKRLTGAYSDKSPLACVMPLPEDAELAVFSSEGRALVFQTALMAPKSSRTTQGVGVMNMKAKFRLERVVSLDESGIVNKARYRVRTIPAAGAILRDEDRGEEQTTIVGVE